MKAKFINWWWQHAHSLGVWWVILGVFTISYGVYMIYTEGTRMIPGMAIGIAILIAGIKAIQTYNKRKALQ